MAGPFSDASASSLLAQLRSIFEDKRVTRKQGKHIVFVCGGPTRSRKKSTRRRFLEWSKTNFREILPLLAEDAYKPTVFYDPPTIIDLAEFETIICEIADCIVVFPESAGSFAEIGYFAAKDLVSKRILVANSVSLQSEDSFISLGPIRKIDRTSFLEPAVQLPKACTDFAPIKKRLKKRLIDSAQARRFEYKPYWKLGYKEKFLAAFQLISILQPIGLESLHSCFKAVFEESRPQEIGHVVAILHAAGYVRSHTDLFALAPGIQPLLEFEGVEMSKIRASVLLYYKKNHPDLTRLLKRL